jgi:hypothetical protein
MLNTGLQPRTERSEAPGGCNSTRKASNRTEFSFKAVLREIELTHSMVCGFPSSAKVYYLKLAQNRNVFVGVV